MRLRHWIPRDVADYSNLVLCGLALAGLTGVFLGSGILMALGAGVAPACAISAYWWSKQARARGKLMSLPLWMKEAPFEEDYRNVRAAVDSFTRVDALAFLAGHASYGKRMRQAAERAERDLRENAWTPPI